MLYDLQEMTVNDGGFLNAVRDGSCTHVLNLLDSGGIDLEQRDQVRKETSLLKSSFSYFTQSLLEHGREGRCFQMV